MLRVACRRTIPGVLFIAALTGGCVIIPSASGSSRPDTSLTGRRPVPAERVSCSVSVHNGSGFPLDVTFNVHSQRGSRSGSLGTLPAGGSAEVVAICGETVVAYGRSGGRSTRGTAIAAEDGDAVIDLKLEN